MSFVPVQGIDVSSIPWSECTFVLPALAVGNIGQLAVDLLLTTYKPQLVGFWYDPNNVMPFAANDVLAVKKSEQIGQLSTGIDIHYSPQYKALILQQRSPLLARRSIPFVSALVAWLRERRIGSVALLTSGPSHKREDKELLEAQSFQFFTVEPSFALPEDLPLPPAPSSPQMTDQPDADAVLISHPTTDVPPITSPADPRLALLPLPLFDTPAEPPARALQQPLAASALALGWSPTVPREDMYTDARRGGYGPYAKRRGYGDADDIVDTAKSTGDKDAVVVKDKDQDGKDRVGRLPTYFPLSVAGQGITTALARACRRAELPLLGVVALAYRGDNKSTACAMAERAHAWLSARVAAQQEVKWVEPLAWQYLYGAESEHSAAWE